MEDWIDTYHTIRRLTQEGTHIFITDNAVGQHEEENLRHLAINLGTDARLSHITPFLTTKHSLDYCLRYASRASDQGFRGLVVLGGDRHDGVPRCVPHASELRRQIRRRIPELALGGWANPHSDVRKQVDFLERAGDVTDFFLTQVVSHHSLDRVLVLLDEMSRRRVSIPAVFGVFYYRSARAATLQTLGRFFSVPARELEREFLDEKLAAEEVCSRTIRRLMEAGVRRMYISNLPVADAPARLHRMTGMRMGACTPLPKA